MDGAASGVAPRRLRGRGGLLRARRAGPHRPGRPARAGGGRRVLGAPGRRRHGQRRLPDHDRLPPAQRRAGLRALPGRDGVGAPQRRPPDGRLLGVSRARAGQRARRGAGLHDRAPAAGGAARAGRVTPGARVRRRRRRHRRRPADVVQRARSTSAGCGSTPTGSRPRSSRCWPSPSTTCSSRTARRWSPADARRSRRPSTSRPGTTADSADQARISEKWITVTVSSSVTSRL